MSLTEMSCEEFVNVLGSKAPAPGGGGAAALVAAVGTALGSMVAALTVGKKKYADAEDEMLRLAREAEELRRELLALVQRDADAFAPLSRAYGLPSDTDETRAEKAKAMEDALRTACAAPLDIMEACCKAIKLHQVFAEKGSRLAISDAGAGAVFCKAALSGASLSVFINTAAMRDQACAREINARADRLLAEYEPLADKIFADVRALLRK
ncbi:MAG: cyclodeaminase/cyclohydrolase family protein [Clostridiales Family XIII bacterium]|jgi:formiminotetrahydrofolate cyclodeaminase|nr:cyclodeaminase/cyclohydrolase family protein [Clostridiales Family XIII bacterium]